MSQLITRGLLSSQMVTRGYLGRVVTETANFAVHLFDRSARIAFSDESPQARLKDRSSRIEFSDP